MGSWEKQAGEETIEPKRACKANKNKAVGIDAGNKTHLATRKISWVAPPQQSNHAPLPIFHLPIPQSRGCPISS